MLKDGSCYGIREGERRLVIMHESAPEDKMVEALICLKNSLEN